MNDTMSFSQFLLCIGDDNRKAFLDNLRNLCGSDYREWLMEQEDTRFGFINSAFIWSETPQGHEFWRNVAGSAPSIQ